jgi:hypothetical protein
VACFLAINPRVLNISRPVITAITLCRLVSRWFLNDNSVELHGNLYDLKLARRQDSIKPSLAISRVRCTKENDVSGTNSGVIIRAVICYRSPPASYWSASMITNNLGSYIYIWGTVHTSLMITEMVLETSVSFINLTQLIAREDFIGCMAGYWTCYRKSFHILP